MPARRAPIARSARMSYNPLQKFGCAACVIVRPRGYCLLSRSFSATVRGIPENTIRGSMKRAAWGALLLLLVSGRALAQSSAEGADMGSFRQGWAGLYVGLSTDSIEDTQVKTGGVDASAPLGVGVVINIA